MTELLSDGVTEAQAPTASTTVVLILNDINDNAPQFFTGTYTGFVDENEEQGHIVLPSIVAFDADIVRNNLSPSHAHVLRFFNHFSLGNK